MKWRMEGGDCGEQARHVGTRGTTVLLVARPRIGHRKQAKTCGSKEINASPFLVCRLYTERACSLVGQYLEGMEKDASLMSGIKDRHCAMDDALL